MLGAIVPVIILTQALPSPASVVLGRWYDDALRRELTGTELGKA